MKSIEAWKLSGAGNDFIAITASTKHVLGSRFESWVQSSCRRGISIGADGVLVIEDSGSPYRFQFYNPDASMAFCGNGTRCAARFVQHRVGGDAWDLETDQWQIPARAVGDQIQVDLPLVVQCVERLVESDGESYQGFEVDAGCPHFVYSVEDVDQVDLMLHGTRLRHHPAFGSAGCNVDIAAFDRSPIRLRTFERGVEGETLACGSGAIAVAAVKAKLEGAQSAPWELEPASGIPLQVQFLTDGITRLTGDARLLFEGKIFFEGAT